MKLSRTLLGTGLAAAALLAPATAFAAAGGLGMSTDIVRTMLILTLLAVAPAIFISMTSFIRCTSA